jgi:uncharacterized protein YhfF
MTETIVKTVKVNKADRFIADQHTVGNYRVTIRTSYYQKAKCYITQTVKVNRYNFQDLQKYHALAVAEADDSLIVTELLLKGKTNSEIYGKGN